MISRLLPPLAAAALLLGADSAPAQTTISTTQKEAYFANAGWADLRPSVADGVRMGQYYCDGYAWAANVGWISFGAGVPANGYSYANNSSTDWGVNVEYGTAGYANLRGQAYGANVGWITFDSFGGSRISLLTGSFEGYAWSANLGWISLGGLFVQLRTLSLDPGPDTNGNGVPDPWEWRWFHNLFTVGATTDFDKDGISDRDEYLAGTNPLTRFDKPGITAFSTSVAGGTRQTTITFNSTVNRYYRIETNVNIAVPGNAWIDAGLGAFVPDIGSTTTRSVSHPEGPKRFYRVVTMPPLAP